MSKLEQKLNKLQEQLMNFQSTQISINQKLINTNKYVGDTLIDQSTINHDQNLINWKLIERIEVLEKKVKELESK